jgi:hypothetical protein
MAVWLLSKIVKSMRAEAGSGADSHGNAKEDRRRELSRAQFLRNAAPGLAAAAASAVVLGVTGSEDVKAATNDPTLLGNSGNGGTPNLAEDATEVQYDGAGAPGVVFLAQADNKWSPLAALYPAAVAGWTSTNANIPNGVYGYTERPAGNGVVGIGVASDGVGVQGYGNLLGAAFAGPSRAPLNLRPESVPAPPPTGKAGDFYVTINVDAFAALWFHTGITGWKQVSLF